MGHYAVAQAKIISWHVGLELSLRGCARGHVEHVFARIHLAIGVSTLREPVSYLCSAPNFVAYRGEFARARGPFPRSPS